MSSGNLRGAGILITRPARQAAALAREIAALGGKPIIFPAMVILPPEDVPALARAQRELASYDYAVFVSANAVEYGVGDPAAWPAKLIAFAPGPGTAAALAAVGVTNARVPSTTMDSEGLLALPELQHAESKRVVIFRGGGGRELLADALTSRGAHVDYVECYRRARPEAGAEGLEDALREGRIDAVTLTSSEGLDNLWNILGAAARDQFVAIPAFMPHARIAARASKLGVRQTIVTEAADAGLIAALLEYFAAR
ncbi:MAG TPA: uroporphyrinogen-III synthase [Casimicrobiaceae bacterium]|nr:uroporphyrinogen-III synthase [Casimicrobiaceae bacterium]